jgi:hypothetical protein
MPNPPGPPDRTDPKRSTCTALPSADISLPRKYTFALCCVNWISGPPPYVMIVYV